MDNRVEKYSLAILGNHPSWGQGLAGIKAGMTGGVTVYRENCSHQTQARELTPHPCLSRCFLRPQGPTGKPLFSFQRLLVQTRELWDLEEIVWFLQPLSCIHPAFQMWQSWGRMHLTVAKKKQINKTAQVGKHSSSLNSSSWKHGYSPKTPGTHVGGFPRTISLH